MPTIRCKEKIRNERRMHDRLKRRTGMIEKPITKILDVPGEMIRETRVGNVTRIKYCDKAHGGSPVTFIVREKQGKRRFSEAEAMKSMLHASKIIRKSSKHRNFQDCINDSQE